MACSRDQPACSSSNGRLENDNVEESRQARRRAHQNVVGLQGIMILPGTRCNTNGTRQLSGTWRIIGTFPRIPSTCYSLEHITELETMNAEDSLADTRYFINGLILSGKFLPMGMIASLFEHINRDTLLSCQLVCKVWRDMICEYIWRKRAQGKLKISFPFEHSMPWRIYYALCQMKFGLNGIKNPFGQFNFRDWNFTDENDRHLWTVESPILGSPYLPVEPIFTGVDYCFVSSEISENRYQEVNIAEMGFTEKFMDAVQPPIEVSVWYTSTKESYYSMEVYLLDKYRNVITEFKYNTDMPGAFPKDDKWYNVARIFLDYGDGVATVRFEDKGNWKCKISGVSVKVLAPRGIPNDFENLFM